MSEGHAEDARIHIARGDALRCESVCCYWRAGRSLLSLKEELGHGGFTSAVRAEVGITPRTAQRYMELARRYSTESELSGFRTVKEALQDPAEAALSAERREATKEKLEEAVESAVSGEGPVDDRVRQLETELAAERKLKLDAYDEIRALKAENAVLREKVAELAAGQKRHGVAFDSVDTSGQKRHGVAFGFIDTSVPVRDVVDPTVSSAPGDGPGAKAPSCNSDAREGVFGESGSDVVGVPVPGHHQPCGCVVCLPELPAERVGVP